MDRGEDDELGALGILSGTFEYILSGMAFHLLSTDRRIGLADAGKEQAEILINLGAGAYGGTWVARDHLLFDGDGRRKSLDEVALWFAHSAQELSGIGGERLHVSALPLGIECVESQ